MDAFPSLARLSALAIGLAGIGSLIGLVRAVAGDASALVTVALLVALVAGATCYGVVRGGRTSTPYW